MTSRHRAAWLGAALVLLLAAALADIAIGDTVLGLAGVLDALLRPDPDNYGHAVILYQRLPRALIAIYVGAVTAVCGVVLQGLIRNPLASPSTVGLSSGATLFVVAGISLFDIGLDAQGLAALAGATTGFAICFAVARSVGLAGDPRGLSLILSGALVSMLLISMTNALLLSDPARRTDLLGWVSGDINHVYADRLYRFWWIGALAIAALFALARPLTLILLGQEKAASAGVDVRLVSRIALVAVMAAAGSAVAICGPVGFVGLVVPHMVRPLVGAGMRAGMAAAALLGAALCLFADLAARELFRPYLLHTGIVMDVLGGIVFLILVRAFYLKPGARPA